MNDGGGIKMSYGMINRRLLQSMPLIGAFLRVPKFLIEVRFYSQQSHSLYIINNEIKHIE